MKATRKNLIIVPVGTTIEHFVKLHNINFDMNSHWRNFSNERNYDILAIQYGDFVPEENTYDNVVSSKGNKWKIVKQISKYIDFSQWEYIGVYDDDLITTTESVNYAFQFAKDHSIGAYQQALSVGSESNWVVTRQNTDWSWAETDFIEIMCPVFEKNNFTKLIELLNLYEVNHGWGLDFIFHDYFKCNLAIIHAAPVFHPSRPNTGSTYIVEEAFKEKDIFLNHVYKKINPNYSLGLGSLKTFTLL